MSIRAGVAQALRAARKLRRLSQERLDAVTSRTYISALERGLKSPTLDKLEQIAGELDIHPVSLLAYSYLQDGSLDYQTLLEQVEREICLLKDADHP
jgi:transcriptional regulator with XRE-family HTH domain